MTAGERFLTTLPRKTRFYDRHQRRTYDLTRAVAARLIDDPRLVENGLLHLQRHMQSDSFQSRYFAIWCDLLRRDVKDIVRSLLADTPEGEILRDTQPVFCVLAPEERQRIVTGAERESIHSGDR